MTDIDRVTVAEALYTTYCAAVGGVAFNGDPLPDWKTFSNDPEKAKQARAWLAAADRAMDLLLLTSIFQPTTPPTPAPDQSMQYHVRWQQHPFDAIMTLLDGVNHLLSKSLAPITFAASADENLITITLQPTTPPTPMPIIEVPKASIDHEIEVNKSLRRDIDARIQELKSATPSRERKIAIYKLQEAVMWLGMDLKRIGEENPGYIANPYPNSKDPGNTVIDRTADGLKL